MGHRSLMLAAGLALGACTGSQTVQHIPVSAPVTPPPAPSLPPVFSSTTASATIRDLAGARIGSATFTDTYSGILIRVTVTGIGLGAHGVHIHETGKCEAPFTTAGAHANPQNKRHGFQSHDGPHLGDLPNIDMPAAGTLKFEFVLPGATLKAANAILDDDGAAIVIHSSRDDYMSEPSGGSGGRLACGIITVRSS